MTPDEFDALRLVGDRDQMGQFVGMEAVRAVREILGPERSALVDGAAAAGGSTDVVVDWSA